MITSDLSVGRVGPRPTREQSEPAVETVRCLHGANELNLTIKGKTVAWVRANLRDALNIAPGALALLDGRRVGEDLVLESGWTLEFLRPVGRKGVGRVWTVEQFCELFQIDQDQFDHLLGLGLRPLRWPDGTIRLCEDQVDRFLDQHLGPGERLFATHPEDTPILRPQGPYRKHDAARLLGVSERTINRWAASGTLKVFKKGRVFLIERAEIDRLLKKHTR